MESIFKALRGFKKLGKSSSAHGSGKSPQRSSETHTDRDNSREADDLLRLLAANLTSYALRKYHSSSHNKKRIAAGGVEIDLVILQAIGEKVLEKVLQAVCNAAEASERRDHSGSPETRRRRKKQDEERHRGRRRYSSRPGSEDRHGRGRHERHHGRDHHSPRRDSHTVGNPSITIMPPETSLPPQPPRGSVPATSPGPGAPTSSEFRRPSRRRDAVADNTTVQLDDLRGDLEALSERLIDLSAKAALPAGRTGHGDCEFYEKFVERSGPVQDVIGEVLGKIREYEESQSKKGKERLSSRR